MTCDSGDACFIHAETWFLNGSYLEKVESGRVKEEEGENCERVDSGMNEGQALESPELRTIVAMCNEIGDKSDSRGDRREGKENTEKTFTNVLYGESADGGKSGMKCAEGECVENDFKVSGIDSGKIGEWGSRIGNGVVEGEKEGQGNCSRD